MPNWCHNKVTIHGTQKQIQKLVGGWDSGKTIETFLPTPKDADGELCENWYEWRLANWGCKWDFGQDDNLPTDMYFSYDEEKYGSAYLDFSTAWSPPIGFYKALAAQGYTVEAYYWEPGMQMCGQWSNPLSGIVDEHVSYTHPNEIPNEIQWRFHTKEFYQEVEENEVT